MQTGLREQSPGFSLLELVVVIVISSILLNIAYLNFQDWQLKNNVEAQVKQMVTDFSALRVRAMTTKQRYSITVNAKNYVFKSYSSDDEPLALGTIIPGGTRTVNYGLKTDSSTFYSDFVYEIDQRGMLVNSNGGTIYLDSNRPNTIDCLTIGVVRINAGTKNAAWSKCDAK